MSEKVQYDLTSEAALRFCDQLDLLPEEELREVTWRIEREFRARRRIQTVLRDHDQERRRG